MTKGQRKRYKEANRARRDALKQGIRITPFSKELQDIAKDLDIDLNNLPSIKTFPNLGKSNGR